jgi:hypothetical protein
MFDVRLQEEKGEVVLNPTGCQAPARIVVSSKDYRKIGLQLAIQSLK